ncbi:g13497 [Coccomyxa viridis]|uniref:G13497 protein n=1 Tax=Coccomyxa viridis TaxID=1274662 RepID=A0ABP1GHL2_9CHLO
MRGLLAFLVCLLALQTSTGVSARFLLDLRSLPLHGRHLRVDYRGEDPIGADTRGSDPIGRGASSTEKSLASQQSSTQQPSESQAPSAATSQAPAPTVGIAEAPAFAARPTTTVAEAPAFAARPQVTAPAAPMPEDSSATLQAQTQGNAPSSAPAGESAPSASAFEVPTLESILGRRRLSEGTQEEGTGAAAAVTSPDRYSHSVFKQPKEAPTSAQSSTGGPVPLSTILFTQVPPPGKPTLATAPTTAPGGTEAPTAAE